MMHLIGQEIRDSASVLNAFSIYLFLGLYFFFFLLMMDLDWTAPVSSLGGLGIKLEDGISTGSLITVMSTS